MASPAFLRRPAPKPPGPAPVSVLHTTCEGVWILQGLCGIETLPATLVLRPWVAEGGTPIGHPGVAVLAEAGALIDGQTPHPRIAAFIEALGGADIELCASVRRGEQQLRLVVARRGQLHVAASRCGDDVTLEEVGNVVNVRDLVARMLPLCGPDVEPARFDPISVRSAEFIDGLADMVRGEHSAGCGVLGGLGLSAEQRRIVMLATEAPLMEASFAVVVHDRRGDHVGLVSASVIDTEAGRVVTGPRRADDGMWWTQIMPGTSAAAARAVDAVVSSMGVDWQEHSRDKG